VLLFFVPDILTPPLVSNTLYTLLKESLTLGY